MKDIELKALERLLKKMYAEIGIIIDDHSHVDTVQKFEGGRIVFYNCTPKGKVMRFRKVP